MSEYALQVKDLDVQYYTDAGVVYANNEVTFNLRPKERLGLVGESGSGKSTMALALMRMITAAGQDCRRRNLAGRYGTDRACRKNRCA